MLAVPQEGLTPRAGVTVWVLESLRLLQSFRMAHASGTRQLRFRRCSRRCQAPWGPLLGARCSATCFPRVRCQGWELVLYPFCRWGKQGSGRLGSSKHSNPGSLAVESNLNPLAILLFPPQGVRTHRPCTFSLWGEPVAQEPCACSVGSCEGKRPVSPPALPSLPSWSPCHALVYPQRWSLSGEAECPP